MKPARGPAATTARHADVCNTHAAPKDVSTILLPPTCYLFLGWSVLFPYPAHPESQGSDVFSTSGEYDRFAVGGAHRWYDNHSTKAKQKSSHCLSIEEAKAIQDAALALDEQARQPGLDSPQASALHKQANEHFAFRDKKIRAFIDCFNQANRQKVPQSDQFSTRGDSLAPDEVKSPGEKSIKRTPKLPGRLDANVKISTVKKAIDDCLNLTLPNYAGTDWDRVIPESAGTKSSGPLQQSFDLSEVASNQAIAFLHARYGGQSDRELTPDYLIGWLTNCLIDQRILPRQEPRILYRRYMEAHESPNNKQETHHRAVRRVWF